MPEDVDAVFSPCQKYRYWLRRRLKGGDGVLNMVMLNPSTATATTNDPTVARCQKRAQMLGFAELHVTNIFAWRSTDPAALYTADDPVGPDNNDWLLRTARAAQMVVAGWGQHGLLNQRSNHVCRLLFREVELYHLKLAKNGEPYHPLYLPYSLQPLPYHHPLS